MHLLEEFRDNGVVPGVQSIAVDSQVELQPAGTRVVGYLVFTHSDVGHSSRLAVQLHMSEKREEVEQSDSEYTRTVKYMCHVKCNKDALF